MRKIIITLSAFVFNISVACAASIIPSTGALSSKFKYGTLQLFDIPKYLAYITDNSVWVAGLLAVIFSMIGGYYYLIGAYSDSPDQGKSTLKNVFIGLTVVMLSWMIIDLFIRLITE